VRSVDATIGFADVGLQPSQRRSSHVCWRLPPSRRIFKRRLPGLRRVPFHVSRRRFAALRASGLRHPARCPRRRRRRRRPTPLRGQLGSSSALGADPLIEELRPPLEDRGRRPQNGRTDQRGPGRRPRRPQRGPGRRGPGRGRRWPWRACNTRDASVRLPRHRSAVLNAASGHCVRITRMQEGAPR
jgi:hypothetical protein